MFKKRGGKVRIFSLFKNRKALSDVITTLIIILLSLVALGIIWIVVSNILQSSSEQVEIEQFTVGMNIKSVKFLENNGVSITLKRESGKGEFIGLNFIFSDGKESEVVRKNITMKELETQTFNFTLTKLNIEDLKVISVAPIFKLASGKEKQGSVAGTYSVAENKSITMTGEVIDNRPNFEKYGPIGAGKSEYTIDSSSGLVPKFTLVIVDPLDVHLGETQTFTAHVSSDYSITEVVTRTQLDNEVLELPLEEISPGIYSANWKVYDTHSNVYRTNFTAKDSEGNENTVTMTWTDPCTGFTHGSTSTITQSCTISTIDGVDNGNIVLGTGGVITINNGAYLAYTPGYSISKNGGSLALSSTGIITKQYLFYYDTDVDQYAKNASYMLSVTGTNASGKMRPIYTKGTSDCNDASATYYSYGYGQDSDRDGIGQSSYGCYNGAYPHDATSGGDDCNDGDSNVFSYGYGLDGDRDGYGESGYGCYNGAYPYDASSGTDVNDNDGSCYQYLNCYLDSDSDNYYATSTTSVCSASSCNEGRSSPAGNDCNDGNGDIYQTITCYTDGDSDGYGTGSGSSTCTGATCSVVGKSNVNTDCNDASNCGYQTVTNLGNDADNDGYIFGSLTSVCTRTSTTINGRSYYEGGCGSWQWAASWLGTDDCNDDLDTKWRNRYADSDGDSYGAGSTVCVGNDAGYSDSNTDCCDSDANAKPGQTSWFTSPRTTCGGYDYNCSGGEEKQYTTQYYCISGSTFVQPYWNTNGCIYNSGGINYCTNTGNEADLSCGTAYERACTTPVIALTSACTTPYCATNGYLSHTQGCH